MHHTIHLKMVLKAEKQIYRFANEKYYFKNNKHTEDFEIYHRFLLLYS